VSLRIFFGSKVRQEKRIYKKTMLGVQFGGHTKGAKEKKHTQENNPKLMMYMLGGGWND
jgi:hypothetical protein